MKSLTKMLMLGVLASLALLAASSTAASAAACTTKAGSKKYELCVNGSSINETTTVGTSAHLTSTLTVTLPKNWASTITCTTMTGAPSFGVHGLAESVTLTLSAKLSGCKLNGGLTEDGCSVNSEFSFEPLKGIFESDEAIDMAPSTGRLLFSFPFNGASCPATLNGIHEVTGEYECKLQQPTVEAVEHELKCATSAKRHLRTSEAEDALVYNQIVSLAGTRKGDKFSIYEAQ